MLLLALMGTAGIGAWQMHSMQQSLLATQGDLKVAREALTQVTGELSETGESISQSDSTFRSQLKTMDHEIRKLWDVSNKRNRGWINENKVSIEKLDKQLGATTRSADKAATLAEKNKKNTDQAQAKLSEMEKLLKTMTAEQLVSNTDMTASLEALKGQVSQLSALTKDREQQDAQLSDYMAKQAELDKSFQSYRSQANRRLQQLENTLRDMTRSGEPGLSVQQQ